MNTLVITLLQAAPAAGAGSGFWIMMLLIFGVMWIFMIRPQRKQQKELAEFRNSLKKGDKIVTVGGIYGKVEEVRENDLLIRVDDNCKIRVAKESVVKDYSQTQQN